MRIFKFFQFNRITDQTLEAHEVFFNHVFDQAVPWNVRTRNPNFMILDIIRCLAKKGIPVILIPTYNKSNTFYFFGFTGNALTLSFLRSRNDIVLSVMLTYIKDIA